MGEGEEIPYLAVDPLIRANLYHWIDKSNNQNSSQTCCNTSSLKPLQITESTSLTQARHITSHLTELAGRIICNDFCFPRNPELYMKFFSVQLPLPCILNILFLFYFNSVFQFQHTRLLLWMFLAGVSFINPFASFTIFAAVFLGSTH